jgi:hypothetical protein
MRWTAPACEKKSVKGKWSQKDRFWAGFPALPRFSALKTRSGENFSRARSPYFIRLYRFHSKVVRKVSVGETIVRSPYRAVRVVSAARHLSTAAYTVR